MKLLFVDACPRDPQLSRTHRLCRDFLDAYQSARPDAQVECVRLADLGLRPFDDRMLKHRDQLRAEGGFDDPMFDLAHQFARADRILIGAPYWDFSFPSVFKIYVEHISVGEILFTYGDDGVPRGLCKAERALYIATAGSPIDEGDWGGGYVRALFAGLFGIAGFEQVVAEGIDIITNDAEAILRDAQTRLVQLANTF